MNKNVNRVLLVATLVFLVSGCATTSNRDPLEGINRGIYKFNDIADRAVIKPVATAYKTVTPSPIRKGVNNFFNNLRMLTTTLNDLLQFKFTHAFTDAGRFVINTTFGVAGFIDVASMDNIERRQEDFGQTLGFWGVGNGPYLVLPILGPSTLRDTAGLAFDYYTTDAINYVHDAGNVKASNLLRVAQIIDKRTMLLDASDIADNASLDPYAFTRDGYLQLRASQLNDGATPVEILQDDDSVVNDKSTKVNNESK
jgi:phospholipid-binding lipoprotein MlaA